MFECPLDTAELENKLEQSWLPLLNLKEDSLRAYPLDAAAKKQAKVFGGPPPYEPPDYLIF